MCCHGVSGASGARNVQRANNDFFSPEVRKQRRDPFADDGMEGLRADDMKKVAKKDPKNASVLSTLKDKIGKVDISSMVNELKNKLFPDDAVPPATAGAPSQGSAPHASNPVRVV